MAAKSLILSLLILPLLAQAVEVSTQSEIGEFKNLVTQSLDFRAVSYQFAELKKIDESEHVMLTREESNFLYDNAVKYMATRQQLVSFANDSKEIFYFRNDAELTLVGRTRVEKYYRNENSMPNEKSEDTLYINPNDALGQQQIRRILLGLTASFVLMDNYVIGIMPYHKNKELDYLLNYDIAQKKVLQEIVSSYSSPNNRFALAKAVKFYESYLQYLAKNSVNANSVNVSEDENFLHEVIQSSTWYHMIQSGEYKKGFSDTIANLWARLARKGRRTMRIVSYGMSMGFGNIVGLVSSRKGVMTKLSEAERNQIKSELKPLDVLLEKTPFRLTDKMIPGHYGHVAIWLGTEPELKELGIWDQIPADYQEKIRTGHNIVEALRPGVQINSLDHFLNIDDMLVLRDRRDTTVEYKRQAVLTALEQVGKAYDFNFDVSTHKRIVCSELAYVVFPDIKWPIARSMGRFTISPDNVANLAIKQDRVFEPVMLYYKGQRYHRDLSYSVELLLKAKVNYYMLFEQFQAAEVMTQQQ